MIERFDLSHNIKIVTHEYQILSISFQLIADATVGL
jgi:hypothetical protein